MLINLMLRQCALRALALQDKLGLGEMVELIGINEILGN